MNIQTLEEFDNLLDDIAPPGKTHKEYTGGYIQQVKAGDSFVALFGTKKGTNNRDVVKKKIPSSELDLFFSLLKVKTEDMRNPDSLSITKRKFKRGKGGK